MKTVEIFEDFRLSKLKSTRKIFYGILYGYIIGTVILFFILLYFVYSSKYVFNSFLNFIGILPVKYLIEDELLYKDILKLEQSIF
jgi:cadmium resistance protein CadD (predicted permease)